jgi:hypothetical protein
MIPKILQHSGDLILKTWDIALESGLAASGQQQSYVF